MSSPQSTTMFGFFACASASGTASVRHDNISTVIPTRAVQCQVDFGFFMDSFLGSCFVRAGLRSLRGGLDATKSEMIAPGADLAFAASAHHVAGTVLVGAKKR